MSSQSSQKRVSASPASIRTLKRHAVLIDEIDLQCVICLDLVVDATQVICCGALHCRSCITRCSTCPSCRKPLRGGSILPDIRCERLSAAHERPCPYADDGCTFEGNRASVAYHEQQCEFVPRSVLREKIKTLEASLARQKLEISEDLNVSAEVALRLLTESMGKNKALMKSALGPDPANSAMRVLYDFSSEVQLCQVNRAEVNDDLNPGPVPLCRWPDAGVSFHVVEKNHNVAIFFVRQPRSAEHVFQQGQRLKVRLLHPYDVKRSKAISFDLARLNTHDQDGFLNFMTSAELDKYCINGHYFFAPY